MLKTIAVLLNRLLFPPKVCFSLVNKTDIVMSVAKSDEIGKTAHLIWLKEVSQDFVN